MRNEHYRVLKDYVDGTINTIEDAKRFISEHEYESKMQVRFKCLYLLDAMERGNESMVDSIIGELTLESQSINAVRSIVIRNYGAYGVDELRFIYDDLDIHDLIVVMVKAEREIWKEMTWSYVLGSFDGTQKYSAGSFTNHFLSMRLRHAYSEWFLSLSQEYFPELTKKDLASYVKIRKLTKYEATFSKNTNMEIIDMLEKAGSEEFSWRNLNHLRIRFGYEPEKEEEAFKMLPLWQQPAWRRTHAPEIRYWKDTNANLISEDELNLTLREVQQKLVLSDMDVAVLRNWVNRARYEGVASEVGVRVTNSLRRRYKNFGKGKSDADILKRLKCEIRTWADEGCFTNTITLKVLSRIKVRGDMKIKTVA